MSSLRVLERAVAMHGAALVLAVSAARGQAAPGAADPTLGSVVRIRTVHTGADGSRRSRAAGEGLLIRRQGENQRVDVLRSITDSSGEDWMLMGSAPREVRIHSTRQRATTIMRFEDLQTVFTSLLKVQFDSVVNEAEVLGAGPKVLGYDTRRVRFVHRFRLQSSRAGKTQVVRVASETDALIAPAVPESFGANSAIALTSSSTADLVEQVFGRGSSVPVLRGGTPLPSGLALRAVTRNHTETEGADSVFPIAEGSGTVESVDSVEVLSIQRARLSDALFTQPDGYKVVDFGQMLRELLTMVDSLSSSLGKLGKPAKPYKPSSSGKPTTKPVKP